MLGRIAGKIRLIPACLLPLIKDGFICQGVAFFARSDPFRERTARLLIHI